MRTTTTNQNYGGSTKVAIIGAGLVGSAIAFACLTRSAASEILIYDTDKIGHGQVLDLEDAAFISSADVRDATAQECGQADIIIMAAGYRQAPGESRDQLLARNEAIMIDVMAKVQPINPQAILLVVANPVNILTCMAQKLSGLPAHQVIGSGTYLDTIRLRHAIKKELNVSEASIQAYVVGDHGDKQVAVWSSATVGGQPLSSFEALKHMNRPMVAREMASKIYDIIDHKEASFYGIGAVVSEFVLCIRQNRRDIFPMTIYSERYDACLSFPVSLGARGVEHIIYPEMNPKETAALMEYVQANQAACVNYRREQ